MKKEELVAGKYYTGLERFSCGIGFWNGHHFMGFGYKFGQYVEKAMDYYPDNHYKAIDYGG